MSVVDMHRTQIIQFWLFGAIPAAIVVVRPIGLSAAEANMRMKCQKFIQQHLNVIVTSSSNGNTRVVRAHKRHTI